MTQTKRPAPQGDRPLPKHRANGYSNRSLYRPEDGYTAPTSEDRAVEQAIELLHGYGYGIALRCLDCHRPITSDASLRRMRGPRCAARAKAGS